MALPPISRRTVLRGAGVAAALPLLEAMSFGGQEAVQRPRRFAAVYFPNGCSLPEEDDEKYRHWRWFPDVVGDSFEFTRVLEPLEPHREQLNVLGGLSHPKSRELLGHLAGDTWLTGGDARSNAYQNSISLDQVIARKLGAETRLPSLTLSVDGGVGYKSRVSTLSFDGNGSPRPSEHRPRAIFERYFSGGGTSEQRRRSLARGKRVVDLVNQDAKRLREKLGSPDRSKLEEYLDSLGDLETQISRDEAWLDRPLPAFDASRLDLDTQPDVDPTAHLDSILQLMALAFELDLTRVITFMAGREDGMGYGDSFPQRALGIDRGLHTMSHDNHEGHFDQWGPYDNWMAQRFAGFLERLSTAQDAHGSLLDSSLVLYGSCCSTTHNARNYPLALAGGKGLGVRGNRYLRYDEETPLANLHLSMLDALDVPAESFADSTGRLPGFAS